MASHRAMQRQPPGGDCHDILASMCPLPSTPHHRITRPPGGECSDIFGTSLLKTPPHTLQQRNNFNTSSTTSTPDNQEQNKELVNVQQRPENDSVNLGVNGDTVDDSATPPGENQPTDNIPESSVETGVNENSKEINSDSNGGESGNGLVSSRAESTESVTPNGTINSRDSKSNGNSPAGSNGIKLTPAPRVPPGGYSSKLW